jgi:hypothetical protein
MPEPIVTLNEESLRGDLRELVRQTVEDTLNGLLEEEADDLVGAGTSAPPAARPTCIASLRSGPPRHRYLSRYRHEN